MVKTLIVIVFAAVLAGRAEAHAHLESADPPVDSTLQAAPKSVTITFTEEVEPRFSTIEITDKQGRRVDQADVHLAPAGAKVLSVDLKPLPPGEYRVVWHATAVDTHKTQGSFGFTVKP